ncbi:MULTISPECIES: DnaJ C-terminal domain-containing protein [unclassified Novosphingobium]|uniref:DnaJ C-terminal domain-containing protein n=1 Tax=unclassified Novosphingobium TaxID=2644732 RepID=UPI00086C554F|nr:MULTISPECIES: DnaJ C-terminal domain-containing protein [unclassified Novosphingobium]MBN9142788.1 DnaJ domain-containing protein [Novosphingobium sp.]MDR6705873.1 DnaJ-class molecular chaperone [Novosphingobium sp. 1748]ODU85045.1 MAG: molecular chaperone DnaJ [Novosphingobium sp. SCN 63-17]OJX89178.1 MAG: molecular chaperone DnaJ [Novosphingobium sp. 63-713]
MAQDPYAILGVSRGASEKDIKSAYRKLAKELHPDHNKDNPKAAERFSEVTRAYDLLTDKDKRAQFDRGEIDGEGNPAGFAGGFGGGGFGGGQRGFGGGAGPEGMDFGDIFEGIFGGRSGGFGGGGFGGGGGGGGFGRQAPPKGANRAYRLAVSLPDAALCASQRITLADGKTIDVKLPKGVEDGMQIRLAGKGEPGPGGPGDAMITIAIQPHPYFRRDGDDIRIDIPVTLDEAVFGGKVKVPTADGAVMLTVAPGSSSGKTLRIKGRGFTRKDGTRGDQFVTLEIALPEGDADLAQRLEGWRDTRDLRAKFG